jgi:hypothetical protein
VVVVVVVVDAEAVAETGTTGPPLISPDQSVIMGRDV